MTDKIEVPQISCGITRTTEETHKIISSIHLSAVYSGRSKGQARDIAHLLKIRLFALLNACRIRFFEPEGLMIQRFTQTDPRCLPVMCRRR